MSASPRLKSGACNLEARLLPTSLFILPDGHADRCPGRRKLTLSYWVGSLDRPPTDVHACNSIRVCFEVAFDAPEVSPVPAVVSRDMAASPACLACVPCRHFQDGYPLLGGLVSHCVSQETVGDSVCFASTLAAEFAFSPSELVEVFNSDLRIMSLSKIHDRIRELPSACADIVSLAATESAKFQSCSSTVSFHISVFLESGPAVLEADLLKRNVSSQVELLQNLAFSAHHGDSNAVAVLVDSENVLGCMWRWSLFLKQKEKTVATGHQNACRNPTVHQMFLEPSVCAVLLYRQTKPFMVNSYAEDWMVSACAFEAEKPFVETHRWLIDCRCNFSSLPSVALRFFN